MYRGREGAFQRLERGEIPTLQEFYKSFGEELSDPANATIYAEYLKRRGKPAADVPRVIVDGRELFGDMIREASTAVPEMIEAIDRLKKAGYRVAALTNNFAYPDADPEEMKHLTGMEDGKDHNLIKDIFEYYVESAVEGTRKPEREFYLIPCKRLGVEPSECVFLDDIGVNLKAAADVGMKTIRVELGHAPKALKQLEDLLNVDLGLKAKL